MSGRSFLITWLTACALLVAAMVIIGGLTRLTESGLSIVEWNVVSGALPPITESAWQEEFEKYQTSPQYVQVNKGMSLTDFKNIFWLEYLHRLLGRIIGAAFLFPFLYALFKGYIPATLKPRLWFTFALGGAQGAIGWWMVSSGLIDEPRVSPYLLAFHLGTAFLIFGLLLWSLLDVLKLPFALSNDQVHPVKRASFGITALLFLQILLGALVAGLDAGLTYNTYPLMDGKWIPNGLGLLDPAWRNLFENITTVQFEHRTIAHILLIIFVPFYCMSMSRISDIYARRLIKLTGLMLAFQLILGISALLSVVAISLASAHQTGALALFALAISLNHRLAQLSVRE